MRYLDVIVIVAYLFFAVVGASALVFLALMILAVINSLGGNASTGLDLFSYGVGLVTVLFGVLIIAVAILIILGYAPNIIKEGEEE